MEAIAQVTGIADWTICENGAYIYHPLSDDIHYNPAITDKTRAALLVFAQKLYQEPYRSLCRLELGKEICISLNPIGISITDLFERLKQEIDTELLYLNHSTTAVDITPKGVNKASGLQLLAQHQACNVADFIGIGDTAGDLPFMELCGYTAAPANATEVVKAMVNYLSPYENTEGIIDILVKITNR